MIIFFFFLPFFFIGIALGNHGNIPHGTQIMDWRWYSSILVFEAVVASASSVLFYFI